MSNEPFDPMTPAELPDEAPLTEAPIEEPMRAEEESPPPRENLTALREEVSRLQALLTQKEEEQARILGELGDFNRLFPDIAVRQVPESVWSRVKEGLPLSAAYALYEKESAAAAAHAERINRRNASLSPGQAGRNTSGEYFSPEEVRAMSQRQVHENYRKILDSMKQW